MATILGTFSNAVQQTLYPKIDEVQAEISPTWKSLFKNSSNVYRPYWGQNWLVRKVFKTGLAGSANFDKVGQATVGWNTDTSISGTSAQSPNFTNYGTGAQSVWQTPGQSVNPGYHQWVFPLWKMLGTAYIPLDLIRAAEQGANIYDEAEGIVEGTAMNVAYQRANAFFAETSTLTTATTSYVVTFPGCVLGEFDPATTAISALADQNALQVTLTAGAIARFEDGLPVDIFVSKTATDNLVCVNYNSSRIPAFINVVDGTADTIQIVNLSGSAFLTAANTSGQKALIVPWKSVDITNASGNWGAGSSGVMTIAGTATAPVLLPHGIERILVSTGTLYGDYTATTGINVDRFKWAKSYLPGAVGSALDRTLLVRYIARMVHGRKYRRKMPNLFLTTEGAFAAYTESVNGFEARQAQGQRMDFSDEGISEDINFNAFGYRMSVRSDPFIGKGKLYGICAEDENWKVHMPPRLRNTVTGKSFDPGVEFVAPLLGANSYLQGVKSSTGATTDMLEMPFYLLYNIVPDYIPGMKLTSVGESYGAAS